MESLVTCKKEQEHRINLGVCADCGIRSISILRSKRCCDVCLNGRIENEKRYVIKHKDVVAITLKKYYQSNVEMLKLHRKEYNKRNKNKISAKMKAYRESHKEEIALIKKQYEASHLGYRQELRRRKRELFPDHVKIEYNIHYKIRKERKSKSPKNYTYDEWKKCLAYWNYRCTNCGSTENIQADHVVPLSRGGSDAIENIQPLCRHCNYSKHTKIIDYRWECT